MRTVEEVGQIVGQRLAELSELFTSDARLTFVMRSPTNPDSFMIVTDDDETELLKLFDRKKEQGE